MKQAKKQHMINPVTVYSSNMLNIATKQGAIVTVMKTLEHICKTELQKYLNDKLKFHKVRDSIFEELYSQ